MSSKLRQKQTGHGTNSPVQAGSRTTIQRTRPVTIWSRRIVQSAAAGRAVLRRGFGGWGETVECDRTEKRGALNDGWKQTIGGGRVDADVREIGARTLAALNVGHGDAVVLVRVVAGVVRVDFRKHTVAHAGHRLRFAAPWPTRTAAIKIV